MASQAYNNNNVSLFPLQIWKQPHQIKCSKQFRVNEQDTDCFDHVMSFPNVSASHAWIFLSTSGFLYFYRGWGRSEGTLIESERDIDVLVVISSLLILVEKSVVKPWPLEAAIQGRYEK